MRTPRPSAAASSWFLVLGAALASAAGAADPPDPTRFAADRPLDCRHIRLDLRVDVENKHVDGVASLDLVALRDVRSIALDARDFEVRAVRLAREGGAESAVDHRHDGAKLEVFPGEGLAAGDGVTVVVEYAVDDPDSGLHFFGPSANEPDVPWIVWSQGESTYNSCWFPCFDHPNERQTTELLVTAPKNFQVSSNGRLVERRENPADSTATWHWLQDKPHVAYLVSMIVGEFHVERETWRGRPVEYWVHPTYADQVAWSFRNTTRMLDFFSDAIGVEYPWDRYAQICCYGFGGGMENTAATTLGERALHDERSSIDSDSDGLIAHELAHQWWGDLLTCRDWAHLWLNEGFASYFEALWDEYDLGPEAFAYNMFQKAGSAMRGGAERPIVDRAYEHSRDMFDSRAYPKGAWVLHMLRRRLGDELFWEALNRYATDFLYETVETVDLRMTVEDVSGRSFERFFHDWTERPGHPKVSVSSSWHSDDGLAEVAVKQTQEGAAFHFPLALEFRCNGQEPVRVTRDVTARELTFYVPLPAAPTMVRVDPEQSVLMELTETKGRDLWKAQLLDDPAPHLRIRAARHFESSRSETDHRLLAEALEREPFWGVKDEIAGSLAKAGGENARDALIAGLDFEDARARRPCAERLATFKDDAAAIEAVRRIVETGDPSYQVEAAAIETFASLRPPDGLKLLKQVLRRDSRREVIRSAALEGLGRIGDPAAVEILREWSGPERPRLARPSALRALARHTRENDVDDATYAVVVDTLIASLSDTGRWVRSSAIEGLRELGEPARARRALSDLEAIAANDAVQEVRRAAQRAIEAIRRGEPARVQVDDLRKELEELTEENKELRERLEKLEGKLSGGGAAPEE